ncbi:MAG: efflux RND transporter periplasmic adaptor subunit [Planctomycetota bacterium]
MKRLLWILVAAAGLGLLGRLWWRHAHPDPVAVVVHTVERGPVEAVVANTRAGTVEARRRSKLAPQTGGQVQRLLVREGERVAAGAVLLELWNDDLRAQIALAESQAVRAKALAEQAAQLAEVAERESQRALELRAANIASDEVTDRAVADAKAKHAELAAAQAAVKVAEDSIATATAALERTILRAPFAGIVAEVNAELGEYVTPSPPGIPTLPAIDLIDTERMLVKAPIDEVDSAAVAVGQTARITLDAFPGRVFAGEVTRRAPYVLDREKEARTVDVEVEFADTKEIAGVLPGATADVQIVLRRVDDCVRVPTEALLPGQSVFVVGADGVLEERSLELGTRNWQVSEVTAGLAAGDRVVLSIDRPGLAVGARVRAQPAQRGVTDAATGSR